MTYRDEVLADSPVAFFEFNEANGNFVSTVNGYTATPNGGVLRNADLTPKNQKGVYFDGVDDFIAVSGLADLMTDGYWTFEAWIRYGTQTMDYPTFVRRDGNGKTMLVRTRGPGAASRVHEIESYVNGQTVMSSPTTYHTDTWHHLVYRNTNYVGDLFINNSIKATRNGTQVTGGTGTAADTFLGKGAGTTEYFKGYMASVAFYNTNLTGGRIQDHYQATADPIILPFTGWGLPL